MGLVLKLLVIVGCVLFICTEIQAYKRSKKTIKEYDVAKSGRRNSCSSTKNYNKDELKQLNQRLQNLLKRKTTLTKALNKKKSDNKKNCNNLKDKIKKSEFKVEKVTRQLAVCKERQCSVDTLKNELGAILKEYKDLQYKLSILPQQLAQCNVQVPALFDESVNLFNNNTILVNEIKTRSLELEICDAANKNLNGVLEELNTENNDLLQQVHNLLLQVELIKQKITDCKVKRTSELEAMLKSLDDMKVKLQLQILDLLDQIKKLQEQKTVCNAKIVETSAKITPLLPCNDTITSLKSQCLSSLRGLEPIDEFNGVKYYFETSSKKTFQEAIEFCRYHGMELASVESFNENFFIVSKLKDILGSAIGPASYYWFGLSDRYVNDFHSFVGSGFAIPDDGYSNWGINQPDSTLGLGYRCAAYARLVVLNDMKWFMYDCEQKLPFICELHQAPCIKLKF